MINEEAIRWLLDGENVESDVLNRPLRDLLFKINEELQTSDSSITSILETLQSDDEALNTLQEVVDYIKSTRSNLGASAAKNVGESPGDVMEVGAFGLGAIIAPGEDLSNLDNVFHSGFYRATGEAVGGVAGSDGGCFVMVGQNDTKQLGWDAVNILRFRGNDNPTNPEQWTAWFEFIHTGNILTTTGQSTQFPMTQKAVTDAFGQPTMTSNADLDRTDNSIVATGIVPKLGLEIGDVIEVDNDNLRSGYLKPLGHTTLGSVYQFAAKGNDVYAVTYTGGTILKQTNGEGLFEKIEGVPAYAWVGICFIGNQMYAAHHEGRIYSVDEETGVVDIVSPTNQNWHDLTTDGTHIYGCLSNSGIIIKVDPITKTQEYVVPTSPYGANRGLVYSPIDNSLYVGVDSGAHPIRKLVNMTGAWIDVSTEKRTWGSASYYNGKVYFSDWAGQVWKENDAGDDFELFSKVPSGSPVGEGSQIIVNDILYKTQNGGDIYTTSIIKKDLFTVESIVSDDKIIVNYAHAFGAGSKSLWSQTLNATKFKRIAKWFNAPIGLGQEWLVVTGSRVANTTYTNTTGRSIQLNIVFDARASGNFYIGTRSMAIGDPHVATVFINTIIPSGETYKIDNLNMHQWLELR